MKKKQKLFLGFAVIVITVFLTMTGCATLFSPPAKFPSNFTGTWERAYQSKFTNTLTFTSKTIKSSNQPYFWNIVSISGDTFTVSQSDYPSHRAKIHLKLVGDILEIIEGGSNAQELIESSDGNLIYNDSGGENDWTGTWKRRME